MKKPGWFSFFLGLLAIPAIRRIGYFTYWDVDRLKNWLRDVTDVVGLTQDRRGFLGIQDEIQRACDWEELWSGVVKAVEYMDFDRSEMRIQGQERSWVWTGEGRTSNPAECNGCLLRIELPILIDAKSNPRYKAIHVGSICLLKDVRENPISHNALRRAEHLRRSVVRAIENQGRPQGAAPQARG